ncbi:MAG TPA: S-adenosylmethionine:tRNA ribosyltransferase-isomerase [Bacteroidia bacterium]|nr:S-adenosylmethionine:tRNA ribosyltransferase-isomerase [Bacteroidia bacterium]
MSNYPDPRNISISDYTYDLPAERIAAHPLPERDASKLLIWEKGAIHETVFHEIANEIPADSLLVFNDTRVVRARLIMYRKSGAQIEIFCTDAAENAKDFISLLETKGEVEVRAFVGKGQRWKPNELLELNLDNGKILLTAERISQQDEQSAVRLSWAPADFTFAEILEAAGKVPLPPYIEREEEPLDKERYQTVYAQFPGSVAAPTAGLHFTEEVMASLKSKGVQLEKVTLHVGAGTFKPVKTPTLEGHEMHREQVFILLSLVEKVILYYNKTVIAAGTTSLRALESLYWFGRKLVLQPGRHMEELQVEQWEAYEEGPDVPAIIALRAVRDWMRENNKVELRGFTQLLIAPGYRFRIVYGLITNFHQPGSTLLLLEAAFVGEDYRKIYDYALWHNFRFLSYGDSSLLWRDKDRD